MRRLRTTSTRRLLAILACAGVLATTAAIAQAALGGSGPVPSPKTLARAITDAIGAPSPDGMTARISFTNNLLASGSLPGPSSALTSGADGRLWLARDGRFRLELQSGSGDAQIAGDDKQVTVFDSSSNTVYRATLPKASAEDASKHGQAHENVTVAKIQRGLDRLAKLWTISGADPSSTADQPTYTVRVAPKDDGGLLGAAELAWDAATGVPLRAAVYAQGQSAPVLALEATDISYGAVSGSDVATTPPPSAKVVDLSPTAPATPGWPEAYDDPHAHAHPGSVGAIRRQLGFALAAPATLAGLPRRDVRLVDFGGQPGALVTYGKGLGAIVVLQHEPGPNDATQRSGGHARRDAPLPQIDVDGTTGSELATALGTVVAFERDGVSYVVAGSVAPLAAENAARGLR